MKTRASYNVAPEFLEYQKFIVSHPVYAGMPDAKFEDGTIQWEAPSNRRAGQFKDTHDKRQAWWKDKAASVGIASSEHEWISKTAKKIHPTKTKPCKFCGRVMDIRYVYLGKNLIKRFEKNGFSLSDYQDLSLVSILELLPIMYKRYGSAIFSKLPKILGCAQVRHIPTFKDIDECVKWVEERYIPSEPKLLSPGCMSNAPDRFDGFHSFNLCCRGKADKGRSKENLATYSTDRRAFEFWSDGNWITANKLMGMIRVDPKLSQMQCHCRGDGRVHPTPCSADHIGPISLGFCHRPVFQLLCTSCNSAKNNRMFYSDVCYLRECEKRGAQVVSWYARKVWDLLKDKVENQEDAARLSRIMRDNRFNALSLLGDFLERRCFLFLCQMLDLTYADFDYFSPIFKIDGEYVEAEFKCRPNETKYKIEQKARKVRVAIESLREYSAKSQRNGLLVITEENKRLENKAFAMVREFEGRNEALKEAFTRLFDKQLVDESKLQEIVTDMPDLRDDHDFVDSKTTIQLIMDNIGELLAKNWNADRYTRDLNYSGEVIL